MNDNLSKIITAIKISQKTNKIIKENLIFAITIKLLVLILTILGLIILFVFWDIFIAVIIFDRLSFIITTSEASIAESNIETYMFTGDNKEKALEIAKKVGIKNAFYEMLPNDKYYLFFGIFL